MPRVAFQGFEDAFAYLRRFTDYERMGGPKYGPKGYNLDRTRRLLAAVGDPHLALRVVHVTGTKGKGSTATMIAAILQQLGLRVGLFTSPHLVRLRERVRVDGREIGSRAFAARMNEMAEFLEEARSGPEGSHPTFFEIMTALGFLQFVRAKVDYAVVEVGLGGRLDSTNVVEPLSTVITNVDLDHMDRLGSTVAAIAREKAGILKPGVPAVTAATHPDAIEVITTRARELGCPLRRVGGEIRVEDVEATLVDGMPAIRCSVETDRARWGRVVVRAAGVHQATNAATAIAAIEDLLPVPRAGTLTRADPRRAYARLSMGRMREAVQAALAAISIPGRIEAIDADTVVDVAHNPVSMTSLREALELHYPDRPVALVLGASRDKDLDGILRAILPAVSAAVFTAADHPRAADPEDLLRRARAIAPEIPCRAHRDPRAALRLARRLAPEGALAVVTGSFYLAGEIYPRSRHLARAVR